MIQNSLRHAALAALALLPMLAYASAGRDAITRFSTDLRSLDGRFVQQGYDAQGARRSCATRC